MGASGNRHVLWAIWFLLALCALSILWMRQIHPEFLRLTGGVSLLDFRLEGYEAGDVSGFRDVLAGNREAQTIVRFVYTRPEMVLPLAASLLGVLLLRRFGPGASVFGRTLSSRVVWILCLIPVAYAIADYVENFTYLAYFPPATPGTWMSDMAPRMLPWITSLKLSLVAVTAILVVRFTVLRYMAPSGPRGSG